MDHKTVSDLVIAAADLWPAFSVYERRRRPLAIGIHKDIEATGVLTPGEASALLRYYCGNLGYLRACREGQARVDLNGTAVGVVTASEAANSLASLHAREADRAAKRAAKTNGAIPNRTAPAAATASKANGKNPAAPPTRLKPPPSSATPAQPKRLSLSDLRHAWQERQRAAASGVRS